MSVKKESLSISRKKSLKKEKTEEDSFSKLVTSASSELEESTKDMACDASTTSKMIDTSRLELMITAAAAQVNLKCCMNHTNHTPKLYLGRASLHGRPYSCCCET
jgi:hypothetical protein